MQLLRPPNLLTVPGDPIAGFLLAWACEPPPTRPVLRAILAAAISLLMYCSGLLWNDWFDLRVDFVQRPDRPLPSGRLRPSTVAIVANILLLLALCVAGVAGRMALWVTIALGLAVLAYDGALKRVPIVGPLAMGLCRGLSVLVGAAALGWEGVQALPVLAFAGGSMLYIAAVTNLAAGETDAEAPVRRKAMLVLLAAAAWFMGLIAAVRPADTGWRWALTASAIIATLWLTWSMGRLGRRPDPPTVQRCIGDLLRGLILIQAAVIVATGAIGAYVAAALLVAFVLNWLLGTRFYAS